MATTDEPSTIDPFAEHPDHAYHDLRVARIIDETHDSRSIVFAIPPEFERAFRYKAGQFLTLQIPYEGKRLVRCYSLASSPDVDDEHKVTVKRVAGGRISNWINDCLAVGDVVRVLPPGGLFTLDAGDRDIVLFSGGSGITPVISIIKSALATTARKVMLVYANRDEHSIIFESELADLTAKNPGRLEVVHRLDSVDGFIDEAAVQALVRGRLDAQFFVCGPGPFMDTVERGLTACGIDAARIHIERFVSPPDPGETDRETAARAAELTKGGSPAAVSVHLDGKLHEVPYAAGQTVLSAVQKAGLEPPFSCTEGFCGCCMARLKSGRVEMINNDFLSQKEIRDGWVLTCQSVPLTEDCVVEYPD